MAVLDILPKIKRGRGVKGTSSKDIQTTAQRTWTAAVTNPGIDTEQDILDDPRCPKIRSPFPQSGTYLRASNVSVRRVNPILYEIDVDYESPGKDGENPLDKPPEIKFSAVVAEEEVDMDADGQPILFYATGERPNPAIRVPVYDNVIRVKRNLASVNPLFISSYRNSVNGTVWYTLPAGCVRMTVFDAENVHDDDFDYWSVNAEFQIRRGAPRTTDEKAWYRRVLAQGFYVMVEVPNSNPKKYTRQRGVDGFGAPTTEPVLHAARATGGYFLGQQIPAAKYQDAQWYEYKIFESKNYDALSFLTT